MKKQYNKPELELLTLAQTDVLEVSGPTANDWLEDIPGFAI